MRLLKVMQRQDNYPHQESYNQSRAGGLLVSSQDDRYSTEPNSTTNTQPRNQAYAGQQQQIKVESSLDQPQSSYTGSSYTDTRQGYPNEQPEIESYGQESVTQSNQPLQTVTQSNQPHPRALFENRATSSSSQLIQPSQPVISSTQSTPSNLQMTNIFYENTVNKDSEIKLSAEDRQNLMSDNRNSGNSAMTSVDLVIEEVVSSQEPLELNLSHSEDDSRSQRPISSDRTHVCLTCFKAFKNKPQLTQHELVHNNLRKHVCAYCEKSFKQLCHLNQHIRTHTGERPYKCLVEGCERSFAQLSNLHHHQKNHEEHVKRDLSRQYRCIICDRSYANESSLRTHTLKLHENLKSPELSSLYRAPPTKKRRKKQTSLSGDPSQMGVINLSSDEEGPPSQVKQEGYGLARLANQISPSSLATNQNSSLSTSPNQISSTSFNQSPIGQTQNSLATSPNAAINQILQKRLTTNPNVPELLRQNQHLLPSFPSASRPREETLNVAPFQPLPKVSELTRSLPQNRSPFNPDLPSQSHMQ